MKILLTGAAETQRINSGQFKRVRTTPWTPETWDDGYVDNRGRFRVYRPDYPKAYALGYALRAHVVWWLHHGEPHPEGTNLHHINEVKLDDRLENLACIDHGAHTTLHHAGAETVERTCKGCGKQFSIKKHRLKEAGRGSFCGQACYHAAPRTTESRIKQSEGLKLAYAEGRR